MPHYLTIGILLGLSAGFAPGPLLTLVVSETLRHDTRAGVKIALAPLVTDLPIIVLTLFVLSRLANFQNILGAIALMGGCVVLHMGYEGIRTRGLKVATSEKQPRSLFKGVLTNALSPHPYLFWFSVGAPTMTEAMRLNVSAPVLFLLSFYLCLIGSKISLAILVGKSKTFLTGKLYLYTLRALGLLLCALALFLFRDGLSLLGFLSFGQNHG